MTFFQSLDLCHQYCDSITLCIETAFHECSIMLYKKKVDIWPLSLFMAKKLLKFGNLGACNFLNAGNGKGVFCYANKVCGRAQWGLLLGKPVL